MKTKLYGVKLLYRHKLPDDVFYEESVLRIRAASADEAQEHARNYAAGFAEREYQNLEGETVTVRLVDLVDCFRINAEESEIEEVYSSFSKNRTGLSEEAYLDLLSDLCSREERKPLRHL